MKRSIVAALVCLSSAASAQTTTIRSPSVAFTSLALPRAREAVDFGTLNCRIARLSAERMPLFRDYFLETGMSLAMAKQIESLAIRHASEVCIDGAGYIATPAGIQITRVFQAHADAQAPSWGMTPSKARLSLEAGMQSIQTRLDQGCGGAINVSDLLTPIHSNFEKKFNTIAFGTCGKDRATDVSRTSIPGLSPRQRNDFVSCMKDFAKQATQATCNDPRADVGPEPPPQSGGDQSGPPKQEVSTRRTPEGTEVKTTTTMPDGSRREVVEKRDAQGRLIERTTSDYKPGKTDPDVWVQKGSEVTAEELQKKADAERAAKNEEKAKKLEAQAKDLKDVSQWLKLASGVALSLGQPEIAGPYFAIGSTLDVFASRRETSAWELRNIKNKMCLWFQDKQSRLISYRIAPSEQGGNTPTMADAIRSCRCAALGNSPQAVSKLCKGDGACLAALSRCRAPSDEARLKCLRSPYGPDDAPRAECQNFLAKDHEGIGNPNKLCALVQCPDRMSAQASITRTSYSDPKLSCSCVSSSEGGGVAPDPGLAVQCGDGRTWVCDAQGCRCEEAGGDVPVPQPSPRI